MAGSPSKEKEVALENVNQFVVEYDNNKKKSLKIPNGQSESVYRRRTDNTTARRKRTNNDLQNIHIKLKIE